MNFLPFFRKVRLSRKIFYGYQLANDTNDVGIDRGGIYCLLKLRVTPKSTWGCGGMVDATDLSN